MRDRSADVDRLADLLVGFGANLQPGQILGVTAYLPGMEEGAARSPAPPTSAAPGTSTSSGGTCS